MLFQYAGDPMTTTDTQRIRLGILMIDAGLITRDDLEECLAMAKETGLPVGKIFLLSGKTSEPVLLATVQAQSLLKDGIIELETAYKALRRVAQSGVVLDEALKQLKVEVSTSACFEHFKDYFNVSVYIYIYTYIYIYIHIYILCTYILKHVKTN